MTNVYVIYCHTNRQTQKSYIGYTKHTIRKRWKYGHVVSSKMDVQFVFSRAIRKYGTEVWDHVELETHEDLANAKEAEIFYIAYFQTLVPNGYNMTKGGEGINGLRHSEETLQKIRTARAKQTITKEHRQHISEGLLSSSQNPEVKTSRRAGQAKRPPCSSDTRLRRSISVKEAYRKLENRVKHCSVCKQEGHYKQTCEVQS